MYLCVTEATEVLQVKSVDQHSPQQQNLQSPLQLELWVSITLYISMQDIKKYMFK